MTQEEKSILFKDLCARLPYGIIIYRISDNSTHKFICSDIAENIDMFSHFLEYSEINDIKLYLRPISSMTEEEKEELSHYENPVQRTDFYYSHHIDCRFMIEKGLVLEAPEVMYDIK